MKCYFYLSPFGIYSIPACALIQLSECVTRSEFIPGSLVSSAIKLFSKQTPPQRQLFTSFKVYLYKCIVFVKSLIPYTIHNFLGNLKIDLILKCLTSKLQKTRLVRNADIQTKFPSTTMTKNIPSHCMNTPRNPPVHRNTPMTHYAILNNLA